MAQRLDVERIWWRNVQPGEFYNIERHPSVTKGGQGSLYIEIPLTLVSATLDFLDKSVPNGASIPPITIRAGVIGQPGAFGDIEFLPKSGGRMRIARQNRQQTGSIRHPAWTQARGFPRAPDDVKSKDEAFPFFPDGGLRIYIAKTFDGNYFAGHTKGRRPATMRPQDPMWDLYSQGRTVGAVIEA